MQRQLLYGKIYRATITEARVDYEGSITIDQDLLEAVDILPGEKVLIANLTNGARLEMARFDIAHHTYRASINLDESSHHNL